METVTKILQESAQKFNGENRKAEWIFEATVARNISIAMLERKISSSTEKLKSLEGKLLFFKDKAEQSLLQRNLEEVNPLMVPQPPAIPARQWHEINLRTITETEAQIGIENRNFELHWKDMAFLKANHDNEKFSQREEQEAKEKLREREEKEGRRQGGGEEKEWKDCLSKLLMAILQVSTQPIARRKMETIGVAAIETCNRDSKSLLEFATEIEKALKFAGWQAKIFVDPDRLTEVFEQHELKAFQTFKRDLKMVEIASWNFIDDEDREPLKKVLQRLRTAATALPAVPPSP
jgi:hypothetical protein